METKICSRCEKDLPLELFGIKNKKTGRRNYYCKECQRKYIREHYQNNKKYYFDKARRRDLELRKKLWDYLLNHPCVDCGEKDPLVLDFDHVRGKKTIEVTSLVKTCVAWSSIEEEISKCDIRCSNCHRRKTAKECGHIYGNFAPFA